MKTRILTTLFWIGTAVLTVASFFGYRCPAQGCPACKLLGK